MVGTARKVQLYPSLGTAQSSDADLQLKDCKEKDEWSHIYVMVINLT